MPRLKTSKDLSGYLTDSNYKQPNDIEITGVNICDTNHKQKQDNVDVDVDPNGDDNGTTNEVDDVDNVVDEKTDVNNYA